MNCRTATSLICICSSIGSGKSNPPWGRVALPPLPLGLQVFADCHKAEGLTEGNEGNKGKEKIMALAFEQQRKESDKAFAAFSVYLSQGPERSLAKTARKLGRSKVLMEKWSRRFNWPERVVAYNSHMALVEREAAEALTREKGVDWAKRYQELHEAEWQERQNLVVFAAEVRKRWMARAERCGTLEGYARLLELASKLGHSACEDARQGSPGAGHRLEVTGPGGGPIRVEVAAALKKIYGKPLPGEVVDVQVEPVKPMLGGGA